MFFMIGITQGRKDFDYHQMVICDICGSYGRFQVFMTYMCLSLFFIPCLKWNRQYFVQTSCCGTVYRLDPEVGRRIARGENIEITLRDLELLQTGHRSRFRRCGRCGYETQEDFEYCPKCGSRF